LSRVFRFARWNHMNNINATQPLGNRWTRFEA